MILKNYNLNIGSLVYGKRANLKSDDGIISVKS